MGAVVLQVTYSYSGGATLIPWLGKLEAWYWAEPGHGKRRFVHGRGIPGSRNKFEADPWSGSGCSLPREGC